MTLEARSSHRAAAKAAWPTCDCGAQRDPRSRSCRACWKNALPTPSTPAQRSARYARSDKGKLQHKRQWAKRLPAAVATRRRANRAYKDRNPDWTQLHKRVTEAVRRAVQSGRLVRQPCAQCGEPKVQAHHHMGYADEHRLDVIWLCVPHHRKAHGR